MITAADVIAPLGPLRRETFRDVSDTVFKARIDNLLVKAQQAVARKVTDATLNTDDVTELLLLALAFEQAASIWAGLPAEEAVAGEASFKYLSPDELRKEAAVYSERYSAAVDLLVTPVGEEPPPRRSGRLRRC